MVYWCRVSSSCFFVFLFFYSYFLFFFFFFCSYYWLNLAVPGADTAAGVVATLLEAGADVNKDDGDPEIRYTPLHSAVAREVRCQTYPYLYKVPGTIPFYGARYHTFIRYVPYTLKVLDTT